MSRAVAVAVAQQSHECPQGLGLRRELGGALEGGHGGVETFGRLLGEAQLEPHLRGLGRTLLKEPAQRVRGLREAPGLEEARGQVVEDEVVPGVFREDLPEDRLRLAEAPLLA